MKMKKTYLASLVFLLTATTSIASSAAVCTGKGIELQVLGSGGPELVDARASSGYLLWVDGKARIMVDAGGGTALRFRQAGAKMADLDMILLSHLHTDHAADLPALIKSGLFEERKRALPIYGPPGNEVMPSTVEFLQDLFDKKRGAFRYLAEMISLEDQRGTYRLEPHDTVLGEHEVKSVVESGPFRVIGSPMIHHKIPAVGWRIEIDGKVIVFSGDTNGNNGNLEVLAKDADIFVAHNAVEEGTHFGPRALHMPPSVIGRIAVDAKVKSLVLSHFLLGYHTLDKQGESQKEIAKKYSGPIAFAKDLDCFAVKQ